MNILSCEVSTRRGQGQPRTMAELVLAQTMGRGPADLLFTRPEGEPIRLPNWRRRVWSGATARAGLTGLTPHDLRHTAASLAIASGASVKHVQRMLGHKAAAMTLNVYASLFEDDLDDVGDRLDAALDNACGLEDAWLCFPALRQAQAGPSTGSGNGAWPRRPQQDSNLRHKV